MAYVTRAEVEAKIAPSVLRDALDDDGDGFEDAGLFDQVVASASLEVDGYLGGLFTVPFTDPAPAKVRTAALMFVLEDVFGRRSLRGEERSANPWKSQATFWREHLQKVGNRELPFDAATEQAFSPGDSVTEAVSVDVQST
jgi:hypothetical protein